MFIEYYVRGGDSFKSDKLCTGYSANGGRWMVRGRV